MKHIVIIGAGFGGLTAVRTLRKLNAKARITVIAPKDVFEYLPSAIWVPYDLRKREDIEVPLEPFFTRHDVHHVQQRVTGLDPEQKQVFTDGETVGYDYLIVASGGQFIKKLPGVKEHALIPCEGASVAETLGKRMQALNSGTIAFGFAGNPNDPTAMRGGPIFEFLFGADTWLRKNNKREAINLIFFSPAPRPGQRLGDKAVDAILGEMKRRNITTYLGNKPTQIDATGVTTEATRFDADIVVFMPGVTGPAWLAQSGLELSSGGFIEADVHTRAKGQEVIFVAGDSGHFPGPDWMPKQAHMADLQAEAAAKNIDALINNQAATATFKTELACIIDSLDSGSLVFRTEQRNIMFKTKLLHYAKRGFERLYLRKVR
jgi:sulfide:quinone oxidoreductase